MNEILEKYLYKKYPEIFSNASKSKMETCMCWGCSCGDGWFLLLDRLCSQIAHHIKNQHQSVEWQEEWEAEKTAKGEPVDPRPDWAKERIPQVHFDQVKEKFGALRIYHTGGDEQVSAMITFAESLSRFVCEDCGKFDTTVGSTTKGWIHSTCHECGQNSDADFKRTKGWKQFDSNKDAEKLMKKVVKDRAKNKGKEMKQLFKKVDKIVKRDKKKK